MNRTLVKSPPELWSEISEVESLAEHLGEFGEISISRTEPEHTVAWEGEHARGTVELEQAGWGTKVTLSAELAVVEAEPDAEPVPEPEPVPPEPESAAEPVRAPWYRRWFGRGAPAPEPEAVAPTPQPEPAAEPAAPEPVMDPDRAVAVLEDTLDHLGAAHHRPFSREG